MNMINSNAHVTIVGCRRTTRAYPKIHVGPVCNRSKPGFGIASRVTTGGSRQSLVTAIVMAIAFQLSVSAAADAHACGLNIGPGAVVTISSFTLTVNCVNVAAGGRIILENGGTLVLNGKGGCNTSTINGRIELMDCESALQIVDVNHTVTGGGSIVGYCNTAKIVIDDNLTFTNEATIEGSLQIRAGDGTFVNNGIVEANHENDEDDRLTLFSGTFSGGTNTCNEGYKVTESGATLLIGVGSPTTNNMSADFIIEDGTLDVQASVATTGGMRFSGGTISIDCGCSFTATGSLADCP